MPQEYKARAGQSLFDVCLNTYGSLDFIYTLMVDNSISDISYQPTTGQVFEYDISQVVSPVISRTISTSEVRYSTYANVTIDAPFT
jgi:hypothetical protein